MRRVGGCPDARLTVAAVTSPCAARRLQYSLRVTGLPRSEEGPLESEYKLYSHSGRSDRDNT